MSNINRMSELAGSWVIRGAVVGALAFVTGGIPMVAQAQDDEAPANRKLMRQVDLMERVTSQMLVDSPNFLVSSGLPAQGLYIEEFGVVISFNAALVEKDQEWKWPWSGYKVTRDGDRVIIYTDEEDPEDLDDEDAEDREEIYEDYKNWKSKRAERDAKLYKRGKQEILEILVDYGDGMRRLADDQWIMMAAFLRNSDFFEKRDISHLVMKARMSDLRAYGDGTIEEDEMISRVVIQEY